MASEACYRNLRKYKYQLVNDYSIQIPLRPDIDIEIKFVCLNSDGLLTVKKGYAWDGPSGPTIDTKSFMRGSLIHDALYQLMRTEHLNYRLQRKAADDLLRKICLEDGMFSFRAWYVYKSVRIFAEKNAKPQPEPQDEVICVP